MSQVKQNVILLAHTPDPERLIATSARLCYSKTDIKGLLEEMEHKEIEKFLIMLKERKHFSTFEHASFTFAIEGVSRALTHQLVRHRIASFSQQSQRYVDLTKLVEGGEKLEEFNYIISENLPEEHHEAFKVAMTDIFDVYKHLKEKGVKSEDARYVLPNACETKIIVTMNCRELIHFFNIRTEKHAQKEIRDCANKMLSLCREVAPIIFKDVGHVY